MKPVWETTYPRPEEVRTCKNISFKSNNLEVSRMFFLITCRMVGNLELGVVVICGLKWSC